MLARSANPSGIQQLQRQVALQLGRIVDELGRLNIPLNINLLRGKRCATYARYSSHVVTLLGYSWI
jgi:hypothetical protein